MPSEQPITAVPAQQPGRQAIEITRNLDAIALLFPCDAPEALRPRCDGDVAIPVEVSLGCHDANTLGPRDGRVFTYVAVEIPVSGHYRIKGAPREDAHRGGIHFKECALGCSSWSAPRSYNELDDEIWLRAGRYALRFDRAVDAETLATMAVTIAGEDCR